MNVELLLHTYSVKKFDCRVYYTALTQRHCHLIEVWRTNLHHLPRDLDLYCTGDGAVHSSCDCRVSAQLHYSYCYIYGSGRIIPVVSHATNVFSCSEREKNERETDKQRNGSCFFCTLTINCTTGSNKRN